MHCSLVVTQTNPSFLIASPVSSWLANDPGSPHCPQTNSEGNNIKRTHVPTVVHHRCYPLMKSMLYTAYIDCL